MKMNCSRLLSFAGFVLGMCSLVPSAHAEAAAKYPRKPLLWKVEGMELTQPSYLFGTIHISKGAAVTLHPTAQKVFDASTHFYAEIPMNPESQMSAIPLMMRQDGITLDESIGKDLAAELNAELKRISPALDSSPFQSMKTWVAAILPEMLPHQLKGGKPLDARLWENATAAGKKTAGMETLDAQMIGFNELTEAEQIIVLSETLKGIRQDRAEGKDAAKDLISAYLSGETERLVREMDRSMQEMAKGEHRELGEKCIKRLLTDRDKSIADFIAATLKSQPSDHHFFAAGALHFCSDTSIPAHLKNAGYTVTRIEK